MRLKETGITIDRRKLARVAHHEAGHFVATIVGDLPAYGISIVPDGDSLGRNDGEYVAWWVGRRKPSVGLVRRQIISLFAGYAASKRFDPKFRDQSARAEAADDFQKAREIIWLARKSEEELMRQTQELVESRWSKIQLVARALLKKKSLGADEAELLLLLAEGDAQAGAALIGALGWTPPELREVTGIVVLLARPRKSPSAPSRRSTRPPSLSDSVNPKGFESDGAAGQHVPAKTRSAQRTG